MCLPLTLSCPVSLHIHLNMKILVSKLWITQKHVNQPYELSPLFWWLDAPPLFLWLLIIRRNALQIEQHWIASKTENICMIMVWRRDCNGCQTIIILEKFNATEVITKNNRSNYACCWTSKIQILENCLVLDLKHQWWGLRQLQEHNILCWWKIKSNASSSYTDYCNLNLMKKDIQHIKPNNYIRAKIWGSGLDCHIGHWHKLVNLIKVLVNFKWWEHISYAWWSSYNYCF